MKKNVWLLSIMLSVAIGVGLVLFLHPWKMGAPLDRGKQSFRDGKYEDAATAYREALKENPADTVSAVELGRTLLALKRNDEAIQALTLTVQHTPRTVEAWHMLGEAYAVSHRLKQAIDAYRQALALEPNRVHTHLMLGEAYRDSGIIDGQKRTYYRYSRTGWRAPSGITELKRL